MRVLALALCLAAAAITQAQEAASQPPVFAAQVESVFIDVFVESPNPKAPRLIAQDFILRDNGVPRAFDLVPTDSLPIRAVLAFDTSHSMLGPKLDSLRAAAWLFLDRLRPDDEVALLSFSDAIRWLAPLSRDHAQTRMALTKLQATGGTSVHDALFAALLLPASALRTVVIVFTDGEDNSSWLEEKGLREFVERSNALIQIVAAESAPPSRVSRSPGFTEGLKSIEGSRSNRVIFNPPESTHIRTMRSLAEITGGSLVQVTSEARLDAAFTDIVDGMRRRYVLRYDPENPSPGWHKLEVALRLGKGKVRGRTGYWVEGSHR